MLTPEQREENIARTLEILENAVISEKIRWKMQKMLKSAKKHNCIVCNAKAGALGFFVLHKSQNSKFGVEEGKERFYIYHLCVMHSNNVNDSISGGYMLMKEIEDKLSKNVECASYVDIN